jgi:hypothetical protein
MAMNVETAKELLRSAIALHERHMNGTEPTDEGSQQQLMDNLEDALEALGGSESMGMGENEGMGMDSPMAMMGQRRGLEKMSGES